MIRHPLQDGALTETDIHEADTGDPRVVISICARDEAVEIGATLDAVTTAIAADPAACAVLLVNNSSDDTRRIASSHLLARRGALFVREVTLLPDVAHAGGARRAAGIWAREVAGPEGLILFTDADSRPAPDWVQAMRAGLAEADVVCGRVLLPDDAFAGRPPEVESRMAVEGEYLALTRRYLDLIDPDPLNPEPHHNCRSGCNMGMTAQAWDAIGGVPAIPVSEDRATVAAAEAAGLRVRLLDGPAVLTSARRVGRAPGGMADALAMQDADPDPRLDEQCMAPETLRRRAEVHARLRAEGVGAWLAAHGVSVDMIVSLAGFPAGRAWQRLENLDSLTPQRLTTSTARAELPRLRALVAEAERRKGRNP